MKEDIEKKYAEVKELLKNGSSKYNKSFIQRKLTENLNLRKVFLAIIFHNPALVHEISEFSLLSKPTCYTQLFSLMDMKLITRKYIKSCENGGDIDVINKFNDFTSKMPEGLKNYYYGKTSFWVITDFGKEFADFAYKRNQEFKEKE